MYWDFAVRDSSKLPSMADFNTEIFTANLTNDFDVSYESLWMFTYFSDYTIPMYETQLQNNWAINQNCCLRPNTEFDLPILCQIEQSYGTTNLTTPGKEYDAFKVSAVIFI